MDNCIFCKIAKGEIPSAKIYEDEKYLAFLDIAPANKGHSLVIPKKHHETTLDMNAKELGKLMEIVHKVGEAINKALKPDGYNVFINNKPAAGQIVPHAHFHIVPRYSNDGIKFDWPKQKYAEGEMDKLKAKITQNL